MKYRVYISLLEFEIRIVSPFNSMNCLLLEHVNRKDFKDLKVIGAPLIFKALYNGIL